MRTPSLIGLLLLGAAACGGGTASPSDLATPLSTTGTLCMDPRADAWSLPIRKASATGGYTISFDQADSSPPILGLNAWTFTITKDQTVATGLDLFAKPWMPDHHHGTSVIPTITEVNAGTYVVKNLDFFMAGVWQTQISLDGFADAGPTDPDLDFTFCLADD